MDAMNVAPSVLVAVAQGATLWVEGGALRLEVPPSVDAITLAELSAQAPAIVEALGGDGGAFYPLTQGQLVLRHVCRLAHGAHNVAVAVRIRTPVDAGRLGVALALCGQRHPALRTSIVTTEEGPIRRVAAHPNAMLGAVDATGWSDAAIRAAILEAQRAPFDLESRLVRVLLYTSAPDDHVLLVVAHHLIADDDSLNALIDELDRAYAGLPLAAIARTPLAAVAAERAALAGDEGARVRTYWQMQLSGDPAALDLPLDHQRKRERRSGAAMHRFVIAQGTAALVRDFAARTESSVNEIFLAAFEATLYRHTGQKEIVLGTVLAGRNASDSGERIDCFVRPVPLRIDFSDEEPSFRHLVRTTARTLRDAEAHAGLPLAVLVDDRAPNRDAAVGAMFRTFFAMRSPHAHAATSWRVEPIPLEPLAEPYDLGLELTPDADGYAGSLTYRPDLFEGRTIARFAERFELLLRGAMTTPDHPVSRLPLLGERDREQLAAWNSGDLGARFTPPIEAFEAHAASAPNAHALVVGERRVSYGELNAAANRLAHELVSHGAAPGVRVAVCLERGVDLITTLLAILKTGSAYVPLDPAYPMARLQFMHGDADAKLLVTQSTVERIDHGGNVIELDLAAETIAARPSGNLGTGVATTQPAYLLFTSGSTGQPKGVVATYGNMSSFVGWAGQAFPRKAFDGVFAATSVCFDLSVFEIFVPLSLGGCVMLADSAFQLPLLPSRDEITMINTVPSVMAELIRLGPVPPSVRIVNLAGEALSRELPHAIVEASERPDLAIYNLYGPTEATVYATFARVDLHDDRRPSIGRAIAGTSTYVLDEARGLVPPGVVGELYIGGPGVTLGYWRRPELTAQRYVDDPFAPEPGHRMFRTGDRVRYRPDGTLEFLGRRDDQVKIRGFRVELGEIESALRAHPSILEAVVVARRRQSGDRLVAYLVMREGAPEADNAALRRHLATTLPDYMRPSQFVRLPSFPRTVSGKIDRPALPEPASRVPRPSPRPEFERGAAIHSGTSRH